MQCEGCNTKMKATYIRETIDGNQQWSNIGFTCNDCEIVVHKNRKKQRPEIPSYDEILKLMRVKSVELPEIYGYLDRRSNNRDKNVVRLFYMFLLREVFELEL